MGPLLRLVTWPPSLPNPATTESGSDFLYELVFLLWPTQSLAVIEASVGRLAGVIIAVSANIVLFALVGLAIGATVKHRSGMFVAYICVGAMLVLLAFFGAGFSPSYLNFGALIVAFLLYAIPFLVMLRLVHEARSASKNETTV
jgi:hypothetical protein